VSPRSAESKILARDELLARYGPARPGAVVFTNGCFELLHAGHVAYLQEARALGDALVVGVNSDASARRLEKGHGRPFVPEAERALLVAALEAVDAVCVFDEDTPAELIRELLPAVLVKGADYATDDVVGREAVEASGGRVQLVPLVEGRSTTGLLERIRWTR
jgi:D-beta-D-heptose 7-phosphate kinase/D-beta-D-heptose 1-phosphate adenosyltransferase